MENCMDQKNNCIIAATTWGTSFEDLNCSVIQDRRSNRSLSCYSGDTTRMFLDHENITNMGCQYLFSGVASEISGNNSEGVSLDVQVVKLGWWLKGSCDCSDDAVCTKILSPSDGSDGYRCRCKSGIDGDGYTASSGCGEAKGMSSSLWNFY